MRHHGCIFCLDIKEKPVTVRWSVIMSPCRSCNIWEQSGDTQGQNWENNLVKEIRNMWAWFDWQVSWQSFVGDYVAQWFCLGLSPNNKDNEIKSVFCYRIWYILCKYKYENSNKVYKQIIKWQNIWTFNFLVQTVPKKTKGHKKSILYKFA